MTIEDIPNRPFSHRRSRSFVREKRPTLSRRELIAYLREHGFKTWRALHAGRKPGDPTLWNYRKEFGGWKAGVKAAFNPEELAFQESWTKDSIGMLIVEYRLWTFRRYIEVRRNRPDLVPSTNQIRRVFKRWSHAVSYAKRLSVLVTVEHYMGFIRRFGHVPTEIECRREGIDLDGALRHFGNKWALDRFMRWVMEQHAKTR